MANDYRYRLTGNRYELVTFHRYDATTSSGPAGSEPEWVRNVAHLACVAGANLATPPDILCWFKAANQSLIEFKFFRNQVVPTRAKDTP